MFQSIKKIWLVLVLLILGISLVQAQDMTLKLGTLAPEGTPFDLIIRDMGEAWKTAGVKLQMYSGGVLGDEPDMVTKMRLGQIQVGVFTVVGLAKIDKGVQALSIPMLYKNYAESDYVRKKMEPILEKRLLAKGFKVLNWGEAGWVSFFGKDPILTPEDLKKLKFFVWGDDADTMKIWNSAGYSPVPLAVTDILPNLQTGLINAFDTTPISALSFQWFTSAPHMTNLKWAPLVGATIITTNYYDEKGKLHPGAWDKIPVSTRPAILKAAAEAGIRFKTEIRNGEQKAIDAMVKHGLKVHDITEEQYDQWEKLFTSVYPQISGTVIPADMMDMAVKYRDEYRAKKAAK
jgi:TRAP-type C4-dicarboxylate transport system substrate-binding protein